MTLPRIALSVAALVFAGPIVADCGIASGSVRIRSIDFEALQVLNKVAAECATDVVTVTANATTEHKNIHVPALTANPAEYTVAMVANNLIVPLLGGGLIRPLDDLAASDAAGWDLAAEFVNMYLGRGADFFEPGIAYLDIDNARGHLALQTMHDLTQYMAPDYLTFDTDTIAQLYRDGKVGVMNNWGSLAGSLIEPAKARPAAAENTLFAAAPTIGDGTIPAAALWWDGFTTAANVTDVDAEASFQAMMHAVAPETAAKNPNCAVWLIVGYQPGPAAVGVVANANGGARPYPMVPWMGLLHETLGNELADFITGSEDASKSLADFKAAYTAAAQQAGYLK